MEVGNIQGASSSLLGVFSLIVLVDTLFHCRLYAHTLKVLQSSNAMPDFVKALKQKQIFRNS